MEQGEGVTEVPVGEDKDEFNDLLGIFGANAEVVRNKEGGFIVETTLEDGVAPGKQKVKIELSSQRDVTKVEDRKKVKAYKANSLVINGVDLKSYLPEIFFEIRPQEGKAFSENPTLSKEELQVEMEKEDNPLMKHVRQLFGTSTALGSKNIFMTVFSSSDDLVALFHEVGHTLDPEYWDFEYKLTAFAHALDKAALGLDGTIQADRFAAIKRWKIIVQREVAANINGLKKINELRKKTDLFPDDPDLLRVKKSFEYKTMSYLRIANSWFSKQVTPAIISRMMDLRLANNVS